MIHLAGIANDWLPAAATGIYQGLIVTLFAALALRFSGRTNAATRHAILFATLIVVTALPCAHVLWRMKRGASASFQTLVIPAAVEAPAETPTEVPEPVVAAVEAFEPENLEQTEYAAVEENILSVIPDTDANAEAPAAATVVPEPQRAQAAEPIVPVSRPTWQIPANDTLYAALLALWLAIACVKLLKLGWDFLLLKRLKSAAERPASALEESFQRVLTESGPTRPARALIVNQITAPMAVGFFKPAILLPAGLCATAGTAQIEQIVRHELAHLRRWDDWANLCQQTARAILFFHPAVWWLSRQLTLQREIACDDQVIAASPDRSARRAYASFLTEFASQRQARALISAPAGWAKKSQLKERVQMILDTSRNASPKLAKFRVGLITTATAIAAIAGFAFAPQLAFAQSAAAPAASPDVAAAPAASPVEPVEEDSLPKLKPSVTVTSADVKIAAPAFPAVAPVSSAVAATVYAGPDVLIAAAPHPTPHPVPHPGPHPDVRAVRPMGPYPAHGYAGNHNPNHNADLEHRIARLEELVQSLVGEGKIKHKPGQGPHGMGMQFDMKGPNPKEMERMHAEVQREVQRAQRDVARAAREQEKQATQHAQRQAEQQKNQFNRDAHPEKKARKQALSQARRNLEQQLRSLEREIEHLEKEEERLDEEEERLNEERARKEGKKDYKDEKKENDQDNDSKSSSSSSSSNSSSDDGQPKEKSVKR